jgi:hypothetical protein
MCGNPDQDLGVLIGAGLAPVLGDCRDDSATTRH